MTTVATPTEAADGVFRFGLVELDLLATHAGADFPFPLRVPSFGRIAGEREVLLAVAGETLRARGLANGSGPLGPAAELVTALRHHRGTVDLVLAGDDGTTGTVAMVYRAWALICSQSLCDNQGSDDPAGKVCVRRVAEHALADELLGMVPDLPAARTMPITLPRRAVNAAAGVLQDVEDDMEKERRLRALVRDCGGDSEALDQLAALLPTVAARGQAGVTRRCGGRSARAGAELSWLDSQRGRIRVDRTGEDWLSINPLRRADLALAFRNLAATARQ